jgi:hypothetical protein
MSPREGFGIVVRAAGLGLILHGLSRALGALWVGVAGSGGFWLHLVITIVLGVWMLSGAPQLVAWAYRAGEK